MSTVDKAQLKAARAKMRADQKRMRKEMKAQVQAQMQTPAFVAARNERLKRRRRRQAFVLWTILIILLLLLVDCECDPKPVAPAAPVAERVVPPAPPKDPPKKKKRYRGKIKKSKRPALAVEAPPPPSWLDQFRLQVAARSPRLAACFIGNDKPGALRWSALVHARSGKVSETNIEPVFRGKTLSQKQLDCLVKGLTEQLYVLDEPDEQAVARRVSLIFEF